MAAVSMRVCVSETQRHVSPGSFWGNRVVSREEEEGRACYFATSSDVIKAHCTSSVDIPEGDEDHCTVTKDYQLHRAGPVSSDVAFSFSSSRSSSEIMTLASDGAAIGCASSRGEYLMKHLSGEQACVTCDCRTCFGTPLLHEYGWSGLAITPKSDGAEFVGVHHFGKCITHFEGDQVVRSLQSVLNPTDVAFIDVSGSASPMLAVTEGSQLSIWDLRASKACVETLSCGNDWVYSVAANKEGNVICVGGAERAIVSFDPRKWSTINRWTNCLKYEVTNVHFSNDSKYCYAFAKDSQLTCGMWAGQSGGEGGKSGFRADSRWIGGVIASGDGGFESIVSVTESGALYVIDNATSLNPTTVADRSAKRPRQSPHKPTKRQKVSEEDDE